MYLPPLLSPHIEITLLAATQLVGTHGQNQLLTSGSKPKPKPGRAAAPSVADRVGRTSSAQSTVPLALHKPEQ